MKEWRHDLVFTQRMKTAQLLFDSLPKMIGQTNWMKMMMMNTSIMKMKRSMMMRIKMIEKMIDGGDDDADGAIIYENLMAVSLLKNCMSPIILAVTI